MKRVLVTLAVVLPCLALLGAQAGRMVKERKLAVPADNTPFKVEQDWAVKLTGEGIAGSKIEAKVAGPARIVAEYAILNVKSGKVLMGPGNEDFIIRPTGPGKVTVTITSTLPQKDAKPTVTEYEFEVK